MKDKTIAIIGANGKTGSRVLDRLQSQGYTTRALSRNSEYHFDWTDRSTWKNAIQGAHSVYITYYPDLAVPSAVDDMQAFVAVAKEAGLQHLVLLSGRGEEGAQRAESVIQNSGLAWNIVRASWFMQNFSESFMLEGLKAGTLVLPEPKAKEPFIHADDIADVAVAALTQDALKNQLMELTGPELLSFAECVAAIADKTHREIHLQTVPIDLYLQQAKSQGISDDIAWLMNELFVNVLDGRNASTTNTIERVLGKPARSFEEYIEAVAKTEVWR